MASRHGTGTPLLVLTVNQASDFPAFALRPLEADPLKSNLVLPVLQKCWAKESNGEATQEHLWIIVYTAREQVKFIATCTNGYAGRYPIFLFTPKRYADLHRDTILPGLRLLARELHRCVPTQRVYSVFGPEIVAETFSNIWSSITGIQRVPDPYYHAMISYITRQTFDLALQHMGHPENSQDCRPAVAEDIPGIAQLCYGFAGESPPFLISRDHAFREANYLVASKQVWVLTARTSHSSPPRIATIVAFTRNTNISATITKVYTPPEFRGYGRAENLVRAVCRHLLMRRASVSLFVGIGNRAANVYRRVGFVGIGENAAVVEGVDPWIEIGFDENFVELGHW